jgi:hypothetical protein
MQPRLPGYLAAVVAALIMLGCGMPQGVSVVQSPNPRAMEGRVAFALMPFGHDNSVAEAPSQASAFEDAFVQRLIHVGKGYGLDIVDADDPRSQGRLRIDPHMWIEEVTQFYAGTIWVDIRMRIDIRDAESRLLETVELQGGAQSAWALDCARPRWWEDGSCAGAGVPQDPNTWPGRTVGIRFGSFVADYLRYRSTGEVRAPRTT